VTAAACMGGLDPVALLGHLRRRRFGVAELASERHVLVVGHRLAAEAQHGVTEPGGADAVAILAGEWPADVDAADLGAEARIERRDFDAHRGHQVTGKQRNRGLAVWRDGDVKRTFAGIDEYMYALDAQTGKPVESFGEGGRVDLRKGLGTRAETLNVRATSPGVVYKDLLIQGSLVAEDLPAAPGHIRAFDVNTGKMRWIFHTIPHPGEYAYETWSKASWRINGGTNAWAWLTVDHQPGIVYGATDDFGFKAVDKPVHVHDLHATILHLLGIDHTKLTFKFQGRHYRLTDVHGTVVKGLVT